MICFFYKWGKFKVSLSTQQQTGFPLWFSEAFLKLCVIFLLGVFVFNTGPHDRPKITTIHHSHHSKKEFLLEETKTAPHEDY